MTDNTDSPSNGDEIRWTTPLPNCDWAIPLGKCSPGGFGARRPYSLHTGVDLFCNHNQIFTSVEEGIVIAIQNFSKQQKKRPWLNRTRVVLIEGESGVVAYCNVKERPGLCVGDLVEPGEVLGNVVRIHKKKRRKDKCMLHIELYKKETKKRVCWSYSFPKPPQLLDPTNYLVGVITDSQVIYRRHT